MKIEIILATILLVFISLGAMMFKWIFGMSVEGLTFFIALLAFLYPVLVSLRTSHESKITSVDIVSATSPEALKIEINKKINEKNNAKGVVINVDIINGNKAFLIYKK